MSGRIWMQRVSALLLALLAVPAALTISQILSDQPVRDGEPSPRTIVAPETLRVADTEATQRARRAAADAVNPVLVDDNEAKAAIVQQVLDVFARVRDVRAAGSDGQMPTRAEQIDALGERLSLSEDTLRALVGLPDSQLDVVATEAVDVAQQLARQPISTSQLERVLTELLPAELAVRPFPPGVAESVVAPVIRSALQPTVTIDEDATEAAREAAAAKVADVEQVYPKGSVIVSAGEIVDPLDFEALRQRGLEGAGPWPELLRAMALSLLATVAVCGYLRSYRVTVWRSTRRLLLLSCLFVLFAVTLEAVVLLAPSGNPGWLYLVPAGAVAMLSTILFDPPIGVLVSIPVAVLVAFAVPGQPGVVAFAAVTALATVPLVSTRSARGDLRRAALPSTLGYVLVAGAFAAIFGNVDTVPAAMLAGLINGIVSALIVNGSLPFLESLFGILTATSLLDLADRNHPLLRELEQKALGSYNHSIMVSTMCERAARSIGADSLLASVAALYHDIGKVRRPYFFVENQFGTPNPHDDLEPQVSAIIIQEHVTDGVEMSRTFKLPPEIVEGIASHHGTTLVTYFYRKALEHAQPGQEVDEDHYRYKGRKPSSKEMAILMLADCCEGASRAAAMHNRNLSRADLEAIVVQLIAERVDDGQLDDSSLTFRDVKVVQESFIETLVGVFHPRIAYPEPKVPATADRSG
jgi:putative nucleotidyltransferase with HDIG domain